MNGRDDDCEGREKKKDFDEVEKEKNIKLKDRPIGGKKSDIFHVIANIITVADKVYRVCVHYIYICICNFSIEKQTLAQRISSPR